jgi:hypothetical protein
LFEGIETFMSERADWLEQTEPDDASAAVAGERKALQDSMAKVFRVLTQLKSFRYRQMVVTENSAFAVDAFRQLKIFEGSSGAIMVTEPDKGSRQFITGAMGKKGTTALRVLTTLDNAVKFIRGADREHAITSQGQVNYEDEWNSTDMFMLSEGKPRNGQVFKNARFKVFELALNYREPGLKYSMQALFVRDLTTRDAQGERYKRFHNLLVDVIIAEKKRQMNSAVRNSEVLAELPWPIGGIWSMPIVLWMYKE